MYNNKHKIRFFHEKNTETEAQYMPQQIQSIRLFADADQLNPLLNPGECVKLHVIATDRNGTETELNPEEVRFCAETQFASGVRDIARISPEGIVEPLAGGLLQVTASCFSGGSLLTAKTKLVIRPFWREYHKTLTYKLFLCMEPWGTKTKGAEKNPVYLTFAEAAKVMECIDRITCGVPKICYLVGWQTGGHDHGFPSFSEVNPKLKREEDDLAVDSLRWLMREGKRFNTDVSLHINLWDAYSDSPLWEHYAANHLLHENEAGEIVYEDEKHHMYGSGVKLSHVIQSRLWQSGEFHKRMEELMSMLPELTDSHTIHIDNWQANHEPAPGVTRADEEQAIRDMILWLRERGLDATSEGSFHGRSEPMTGLQPMCWWDTPYSPDVMPPSLYFGGRAKRRDYDPRLPDGIHIEDLILGNLDHGYDPCDGIQEEFALYALPSIIMNYRTLLDFDGETAVYSDDLTATVQNGVPVIQEQESCFRYGSTVFFPLPWKREMEIFFYSKRETAMDFRLPATWDDVTAVDIYDLHRFGQREPVLIAENKQISGGKISLNVRGRTAYLIRPHK